MLTNLTMALLFAAPSSAATSFGSLFSDSSASMPSPMDFSTSATESDASP